jgi:hypothetical protein
VRGDPQVELQGAVLIGRRVAPGGRVDSRNPNSETGMDDEMVTVSGIVLRIGPSGLTVSGPSPDVVHTVVWQRVKGLDGGELTKFEDGSPARSIHVELDDRNVEFLVPADVLNGDRLRAVNEIADAHVASRRERATRDDPQPVATRSQEAPRAVAVPQAAVTPRTPAAPMTPAVPMTPAEQPSPPEKLMVLEDRQATHGQAPKVVLPPPPPSSNLAMPPVPTDAGGSGVPSEQAAQVSYTSSASGAASLIERDQKLPLAVPPARRVEPPGLGQLDPDPLSPGPVDLFDGSSLSHVPSLLPPPPPRGSWSRLPPPPASDADPESEEPEPSIPVFVPSIGPSRTGVQAPPDFVAPAASSGRSAGQPASRQTTSGQPMSGQTTSGQTSPGRSRRGPKRKTVLASGFVLVLACVGGAIFGLSVTDLGGTSTGSTQTTLGPSTRSSSGGVPGTLTGPPTGTDPRIAAGALNIVSAGLPRGWEPGAAPWSRVATLQADSALAGCLGLPRAHLGVVTDSTSSGGPRVYTSGWITSPVSGQAGFESAVVLNQTVATEESDVATLDAGGAASCFQGWFASLDVSGDAIVGAPTVTSMNVAALPGESVAGFRVSVVTRPPGKPEENINEDLVVIGAGRVEVGLVSESVGSPVSASVEVTELRGLESRLRVVATS